MPIARWQVPEITDYLWKIIDTFCLQEESSLVAEGLYGKIWGMTVTANPWELRADGSAMNCPIYMNFRILCDIHYGVCDRDSRERWPLGLAHNQRR